MAPNRTDEIVELLRAQITSRKLVPGDVLAREELLAQDYGVSRACVRESLGILKAQGYLVSRRGKYGGTFISTLIDSGEIDTLYHDLVLMDQMKIKEILEARLLIEPEAARKAASNAQAVNFGKNTSDHPMVVAETAKISDTMALTPYINFHNALGKSCHNPFYQISIRNFMKFTSTFIQTLERSENHHCQSLYNHNMQESVINAIQAQDSSLAFEKMYLYTALSKEKILHLEPLFHKIRAMALKPKSPSSSYSTPVEPC